MTVRVALSGCGAVAEQYYAPALRRLATAGRLRVTALYDPAAERRSVLAALFPEAKPCADLAAALDARPELLVVASPPRHHAEQALLALARGIAVFCEKPLATTSAEAERMAAVAAAADRLLAVGMVRRQLPAARTIARLLAQRVLGPLQRFEVFEGGPFRWPVGPSYFDRRQGGEGVLLDIGAHVFDLLVWWLGPVDDVTAMDDAMGGVAANACVTLRCDGVPGTVRLSRDWQRPNHVTIHGRDGFLRWDLEETDRLELALAGAPVVALGPARGAATTFVDCFAAQLDAVIDELAGRRDALAGRAAPVVRAADVLPAVAALERAARTAELAAMPWLSRAELQAAQQARSA